jgi:hypothetical protein
MPITALPTPPSRQDPTNFNDRADAFLGALPQFQSEANALQVNVNTSEVNAVNSAAAVLAATNIVRWVSGTTYAQGAVVWSPINGLGYRRITTAGSGTTDPSLDTTNYRQVNGTGDVSTSGNQSIAGVKTFTSTIVGNIETANNATTVTNGVYTTGNQTIGGNKTFSSPIIFPDGTFQNTGITTVRSTLFLTSGTYNKPANVRAIFIQAVGATGGRANNTQNYGQGGVGGAGYSEKYITSPSSSYAVTVGAGGAAGTAGGTTSINTISITGSGGVTNGQTAGSAGGVATGGDFNTNGGAGGNGWGGTGGGGGGGGAGASRAGNGFTGGSAGAGNWFAGGGGGGTGAVGANSTATVQTPAGGAGATVFSSLIIQPILAFDLPNTTLQFAPGASGTTGIIDMYVVYAGNGGIGAFGDVPVYANVGTLSRIRAAGGRGGVGASNPDNTSVSGNSGAVVIWEFI